MPFYRVMLLARNDLAVASIFNKFVESAKYVIKNGGVFQRVYNCGDQAFMYLLIGRCDFSSYPMYSKAISKRYEDGPIFFLQFCSSPPVMEQVCDSLKKSTYVRFCLLLTC